MDFFTRLKDIINAELNAALDKAEDPEKMLSLAIKEMEDALIKLKTSCSEKMAALDELRGSATEVTGSAAKWESRAKRALDAGKEDLAKEAIAEKIKATKELEHIQKLIASAEETISRSMEEISALDDKITESKHRFALLKEKEERARNEKRKQDAMKKDTEERFRSYEERINRMYAYNDLNMNRDEFRDAEEAEEIEREMEALKKKYEN